MPVARTLLLGLGLAFVVGLAGCKEDTKLKITGMSPLKGDYLGGEVILVTGNRFQKDGVRSVKVYFGGVQGTVRRFNGDNELILEAPGGKVGEKVDVKFMFEPGGVFTYPEKFEFIEKTHTTVDHLDTSKKKK